MQPGTRLGPYEIVALLGAGGMGEVYRARDTRLGRGTSPSRSSTPASRRTPSVSRASSRRPSAAAQLDHPNILVVHDVGTHEGSPYIVSELLEGESLREMLGAPLPPRKAVDYALQIARGLAAAHEKGIVHRDIKPENVFVTKDGHVKILDFGVAKLTQPSFRRSARHGDADGGGHASRASSSAPSPTCRPSRYRANPWTPGRISSRSASSSTRCCRGSGPSSGTPPPRR